MIFLKNISKYYLIYINYKQTSINSKLKNICNNPFICNYFSQKFTGKVRRLAVSKFYSSIEMDDPKVLEILEPLQLYVKEQVLTNSYIN